MKKMNIVRNTNAEGTETYRERSRIGSINHRIWSVIAPMLLVVFGLFGVNERAWAGAGDVHFTASAAASPTTGGTATVSDNGTQTKESGGGWITGYKQTSATFSYTATVANSNYVFKGWSTSSTANSGTTDNPMSLTYYGTGSRWGTVDVGSDTQYAIFARLTADKPSLAFGSRNVKSGWGNSESVSVTYVHVGTMTATITGDHATDFSFESNSSSISKTVVQNNTSTETSKSVTVYFNPQCNGTRTATLTFSGNGLTKTVSLSGTGNLNAQTLSWENESSIETNMLNGATQIISATATSGLTVSYSSSNPSVLSVNASGVLTAKAVGSATITASQAGDCTYSEATSITKTFQVKSKDTPIFTPNGFSKDETKELKVGETVTLTVEHVSDGLDGDFTASATQDNGTNILSITRSDNTITIEALNAGSSTATFTQAETTAIFDSTINYSFHVTKIDNTLALSVAAAQTKYVGEEIANIISNKNSNATVTTTSSDATIAYYDVTNDKIVIPNSESKSFDSTMVTIHIKQAATYKYTAADKEITLKVKKYQPTISVNKIALELEQTATLTTTNTTADLNVTIEPATGVLSYANGTFTAVGLGDATVTVTQPETRTIAYKQEVFNFHVSKKTPTLVVKMDGTVTNSKSVSRGTVVNVTFEDNSDADVVVTNVSGARAASYINGQMTAGYVGKAVYRASLVETDTYQAKSVDFSLTVTGTPSDHVPYTNATGYTIGSGSATDWTHSYETIHFNGIPDKLTFNYAYIFQVEKIGTLSIGNPTLSYDALDDFAKAFLKLGNYSDTRKGKGNTHFLYVEESADNVNWETIWTNDDASSKDTKYSGEIQLKKTTRYIRFHHSSNFSNSYTNINISELRYVEDPDPANVDFGSAIINSGEVSKNVIINWCNIAPLTVTSSNDRFYVSSSSFGNYENYGTQELTIRFSHEGEGSFSGDITISNGVDAYTKTIHVTAETTKRPQTITWNSDLVATGYAMNVGEQYPDEVITTIATATNGGKITYTSDNTNVIEVIDGVSLSAVGTGKANITAYQAGDDDFDEVSDTKEFTVTELQKQVITWNQNLYGLLTTSGNVTLNATATSGMAITYVSADENVVRVEGNTLIVVGEGETYITASQVGGKDANDVEWLPISQNNYVIVRDPNSQCNGLALSISSLTLNSGKVSQDYNLSGIPAKLSFTAKHGTKNASTWGSAIYSALIVYQYAQIENLWDWYEVYNNVVGTGDTPSGDIILEETATKIRFKTLETGTDHTISNIRVTRPKFMKSDVSVVDQEVETNALWQQTVTISHSNIDVMKISTKKGLLTLSTSSLGDGCEDFGEDQFVVSYTPMQKDAEYLDTIVITDSKAEPTTITIPIRLHTKGWTQEIENFNLPAAALTTDALPALTATATSGFDVRYESSDEEVVRIVNGNELEIITSGTVTIKAIQDGNDRYYETYAEKEITISKAVPALVAPVGTDVTYLAALSTSSLSDGSATVTLRGVENTTVEGTFAWTNPEQQITENVGVHSYSVTFTPDDAAYYASATTTVEINVIAATPEATPSAANIVYGQKVSASLLSNDGTEGKWSWTDAKAEDVLAAGTYNGLAVHFKPTSGNYTGLDATVSLKVEKAAASLTWTTAPTELAFNATGVTYEASSVSDGTISYSIVSGIEYAEIDAQTGELTILVPGQTVTVQAAQAEGTNYLAPEAITINVTIGAAPSTNTFTNAKGDGNWDDPANWQSGSVPSSDPDIFVTGDLVIDEDITVGDLTIESTGSVAVISGGTLTVNGTSEARTEYGDVHVMSDGALALGNTANLQVRDFTLDAALGNSSNAATSGQVSGDVNLHINRDAYFQMSFDPRGAIDYGWYDFTVPFEVEVLNGVYDNLMNKLTNGPDYVVMNFNEARRASSGKGWGSFAGTMQPGRIYSIGFDDERTWNTFIFKKKSGSNLLSNGSFTAECSNSGAADDRGWNGLGNGTLQHRELTGLGSRKVQVYNHSEDNYTIYDADEKAYAVGSAFFLQADEYLSSISLTATDGSKALRAPQYASRELDEFRLTLTAEGEDRYADRMWVSASDDATGEYVIGHDLLKMGTPKNAKVAQMWTVSNDLRLCDIEMLLINDMSQCPLMFFAPNALTYEIAVDQAPEDATLYLTYNDRIIWSLSASPYTIDLAKGMTEGYGLRIVARHHSPSVATGMDELNVDEDGNRKVLIDNMLYIITPEGAMYSVTGEKVK